MDEIPSELNKRIAGILGWVYDPEAPASGHPSRKVSWGWKAPSVPDPKKPGKIKSGMRRKECPDFCGEDNYILKRNFQLNQLVLRIELYPFDAKVNWTDPIEAFKPLNTIVAVSEGEAVALAFLEAAKSGKLEVFSGSP